ncbi:uncharacterized protein V1516DRAFT_663967 [Lipomyces oligophaga]|uniref:uncharacterized protein n=1 Tax=Lipomyces oligophaga TaxID=45792 RepID=UPI0034CDF184
MADFLLFDFPTDSHRPASTVPLAGTSSDFDFSSGGSSFPLSPPSSFQKHPQFHRRESYSLPASLSSTPTEPSFMSSLANPRLDMNSSSSSNSGSGSHINSNHSSNLQSSFVPSSLPDSRPFSSFSFPDFRDDSSSIFYDSPAVDPFDTNSSGTFFPSNPAPSSQQPSTLDVLYPARPNSNPSTQSPNSAGSSNVTSPSNAASVPSAAQSLSPPATSSNSELTSSTYNSSTHSDASRTTFDSSSTPTNNYGVATSSSPSNTALITNQTGLDPTYSAGRRMSEDINSGYAAHSFKNPKLERTISDVLEDELYSPSMSPVQSTTSDDFLDSADTLLPSAWAAGVKSLPVTRTASPCGAGGRDMSPFRKSSPYYQPPLIPDSPMNYSQSDFPMFPKLPNNYSSPRTSAMVAVPTDSRSTSGIAVSASSPNLSKFNPAQQKPLQQFIQQQQFQQSYRQKKQQPPQHQQVPTSQPQGHSQAPGLSQQQGQSQGGEPFHQRFQSSQHLQQHQPLWQRQQQHKMQFVNMPRSHTAELDREVVERGRQQHAAYPAFSASATSGLSHDMGPSRLQPSVQFEPARRTISPKEAMLDYVEGQDGGEEEIRPARMFGPTPSSSSSNSSSLNLPFDEVGSDFESGDDGLGDFELFGSSVAYPRSSSGQVYRGVGGDGSVDLYDDMNESVNQSSAFSSPVADSDFDDTSLAASPASSMASKYMAGTPSSLNFTGIPGADSMAIGMRDVTADESETFVCPECSKRFAKAQNLQIHRRLHSSTPPRKKVPLSATVGPHRCTIINASTGKPCNKVFSRPYDLIRHQETIHASNRRLFRCELCGDESKTFSRQDALARHIRVKHEKGK